MTIRLDPSSPSSTSKISEPSSSTLKTRVSEDSLAYTLLKPLILLQNFTCVCLPGGRLVLSGVEKVLSGGSATDAVKLCGFRPPRYFWYCVSGGVCDVVQLALDLAFQVVGIEDPSINWMLSFFFSIVFRHTTHRYLVFGEYNGTYYEVRNGRGIETLAATTERRKG